MADFSKRASKVEEDLLQEAAENGDVSAMYNFGLLQSKQGNIDVSGRWFHKAADLGHEDAAYALGRFLADAP